MNGLNSVGTLCGVIQALWLYQAQLESYERDADLDRAARLLTQIQRQRKALAKITH